MIKQSQVYYLQLNLFGKKQNDEEIIKIITDLQNSESESISNSAQMFMKSIE